MPLLCSEFGGQSPKPEDKIKDINIAQGRSDSNMLSSIYWAWFNNPSFPFASPPKIKKNAPPPPDPRDQGIVRDMSEDLSNPKNVQFNVLDALTRVYPRVIAGTPNNFGYDPTTRIFELEYSTRKPKGEISGNLTRIVIPETVYGPQGYTCKVENGKVVSQVDATILQIQGAQRLATVKVYICPKDNPG